MWITDAAARNAMNVPKGLSPDCIGQIVRIKLGDKKTHELTEHVGLLESYSVSKGGFAYKFKGMELKILDYSGFDVEVVLYTSSHNNMPGV